MSDVKIKAARPEFPRQRHRHFVKPLWWVRVKLDNGTRSKTPHYGYPMKKVNGKWVSQR